MTEKFMQELNEPIYGQLKKIAKARGVSVQAIIRIMCSDYLQADKRREQQRARRRKQ